MSVETAPEQPSTAVERPATQIAAHTMLMAARVGAIGLVVMAAWRDLVNFVAQIHTGAPDFLAYYVAARAVVWSRSVNPYDWSALVQLNSTQHFIGPGVFWAYIYPPFGLLLILPLTILSPATAYAVWAVLTHIATFATALLIADALAFAARARGGALADLLDATALPIRGRAFPLLPFAAVLSVFVVAEPTLDTYFQGQINTIIAALLALGFNALIRKRPKLAGGALALAAGIKLLPIVFLGYLLARMRWRAALAFVAVGLATVVAPLVLLPPVVYSDYLRALIAGNSPSAPAANNVSLTGIFTSAAAVFARHSPTAISVAHTAGEGLSLLLVIGVLGILYIASRRATSGTLVEWTAFPAMIATFLLASPLTWPAHFVIATLGPLTLLAYPLLRTRQTGDVWSRGDTILILGASLALALMITGLPFNADVSAPTHGRLLLQATRPLSNLIVLLLASYALLQSPMQGGRTQIEADTHESHERLQPGVEKA